MKINKIKILLLSLSLAIAVCSCKKDDSIFSGGDGYISSFRLNKSETTLNAAISNGNIVLAAPENLSLEGATASIAISENASIEPNPASITNWNNEHTFTVTAYNGTKNSYKYSVQRKAIVHDGDVALLTQADVEALAALNLTQINGSVSVGAATGQDSVHSLAPLASLKVIKFGLVINATYAGKNLAGLENLETVGSLQILQNTRLETVALPKLAAVMQDLIINQSAVQSLDFPELAHIDRNLQINTADSLVRLDFPKLKNIVGDIILQAAYYNPDKLAAISFPQLEKVGGNLNVSNWKEVARLDAPLLKSVTAVSISSLAKMTSLTMPALQSTLGNFLVSYNALMTVMDFSSLQTVGGDFRIENHSLLETFDGLAALTSVGGEMMIQGLPELKDIQGLKRLKSVGKRFYISNLPALNDETLSGLSGVGSIGGDLIISQIPFRKFSGFALTEISTNLNISYASIVEEIDVRNLDVEGTLQLSDISAAFTLKGKNIHQGNLTLNNANLQTLEGFDEVRNLSYYMNQSTQPERSLNIRKVNGNLSLSIYNFNTFNMPLLIEIGGTVSISGANTKMTLNLPKLQHTGKFDITASFLTVLSLPKLQVVDGNFTITAANYQGEVSDIQLPALTTVNGVLSITGYSSYYPNTQLTNLNSLTALSAAQGVSISYNTALSDYSGLRNVLSSFPAAGWKVSGNLYNPRYQDMLDGKYTP